MTCVHVFLLLACSVSGLGDRILFPVEVTANANLEVEQFPVHVDLQVVTGEPLTAAVDSSYFNGVCVFWIAPAYASVINQQFSSLSVSFWAKNPSGTRLFGCAQADGPNYGWAAGFIGTNLVFTTFGYSDYGFPVNPSIFTDNNWHMYAIAFTTGLTTFFLDGQLLGSLSKDPSPISSSGAQSRTCWIGAIHYAPNINENWSGYLRQPAMYATTITLSQAQQLFNGAIPSTISGCMSWYGLGDNIQYSSGQALIDKQGSATAVSTDPTCFRPQPPPPPFGKHIWHRIPANTLILVSVPQGVQMVVLGAGPIGLAAAIATKLRLRNVNITGLLERRSETTFASRKQQLGLNSSSIRFLKSLGDDVNTMLHKLSCPDDDWVDVPIDDLQELLLARALNLNITVHFEDRVLNYSLISNRSSSVPDYMLLNTQQGRQLFSHAVILAEGRGAVDANLFGFAECINLARCSSQLLWTAWGTTCTFARSNASDVCAPAVSIDFQTVNPHFRGLPTLRFRLTGRPSKRYMFFGMCF